MSISPKIRGATTTFGTSTWLPRSHRPQANGFARPAKLSEVTAQRPPCEEPRHSPREGAHLGLKVLQVGQDRNRPSSACDAPVQGQVQHAADPLLPAGVPGFGPVLALPQGQSQARTP